MALPFPTSAQVPEAGTRLNSGYDKRRTLIKQSRLKARTLPTAAEPRRFMPPVTTPPPLALSPSRVTYPSRPLKLTLRPLPAERRMMSSGSEPIVMASEDDASFAPAQTPPSSLRPRYGGGEGGSAQGMIDRPPEPVAFAEAPAAPPPIPVAPGETAPVAVLPAPQALTGNDAELLQARPLPAPTQTTLAPSETMPPLPSEEAAGEAAPAALPPIDARETDLSPNRYDPPAAMPASAPSDGMITNESIKARAKADEVKYFTPESLGEPLPPGTVLPPEAAMPMAPVAPPAGSEALSPASQDILDSLPRDVVPAEKPVTGKVTFDRAVDSSGSLPRTRKVTANTERGLSITVAEPSFDTNIELENAYDALLQGDTEGAIRIYQQVLDNNPNDKTALFGLATTYHRIGMIDKARPLYGQLLKADPYNVEALNNFFALLGNEAPRAAIEQLQRLRADNPDFAPVAAQIGLLHQKLGEHAEAARYMSEASAISPENLAYRYNLAVICDQGGFKSQAIALYRELLEADRLGQTIPAPRATIQERLTFLASN